MEMPEDFIERCNALDHGPKIWASCLALLGVSVVVSPFLSHAWEQSALLLPIFLGGILGTEVSPIFMRNKSPHATPPYA